MLILTRLGHEQQGNQRPALVISGIIEAKLFTVIPITGQFQDFEFTYSITKSATNGLDVNSRLLVFQIRTVAEERFVRKRGTLDQQSFNNVKLILKKYLYL